MATDSAMQFSAAEAAVRLERVTATALILRTKAKQESQKSPALWLASLDVSERIDHLVELANDIGDNDVRWLGKHWFFWARDEQLTPPGTWTTWFCRPGRGWGKTRTETEFAHDKAMLWPGSHGFLAARTDGDVVKTLLGHQYSGLIVTQKPWNPITEINHGTQLVRWANGSYANWYSSKSPDQARGPEHDWGVGDEVATWLTVADQQGNTTLDNLRLGLRGVDCDVPQMLLGTTPRPSAMIKKLAAQAAERPDRVVMTTGSTFDNDANLAQSFLAEMREEYGGTRIGRQELEGELLEDVEGAIVTNELFEAAKIEAIPDDVTILDGGVAVDPGEATSSKSGTGIIGGLLGDDGCVYVTHNATGRLSPSAWAERAIDVRDALEISTIIAESNHGGELVRENIRQHDELARIGLVKASTGKHIRFGPVGTLFEQFRIKIVIPPDQRADPRWKRLQDQVTSFTDAGYEGGGDAESPHDADALVWLIFFLVISRRKARTSGIDFGGQAKTPIFREPR